MKYLDKDGNIAEMLSRSADSNGNVRIQIDGEETQRVMSYDEFVARFCFLAIMR